jgi:outer membrane protein assembly factor BamB
LLVKTALRRQKAWQQTGTAGRTRVQVSGVCERILRRITDEEVALNRIPSSIASFFVAWLCTASALANQSATFRADPAHTGVYDSAAPALSKVKWRFHTRGKIFSTPAVANGLVYVGSYDGNLYAVRVADGSRAWAFKTHGPVTSSPAVSNGLVYFLSVDGNAYAVGASDGRERWHFTTGGERRFIAPGIHGMIPRSEPMPDPFDLFLSSPLVAAQTVYFGCGDNYVYALDASNGALRWKFKTGNVVHASPAYDRGTIYIGSWDRNLYALDAATGKVRWKFQTGDDRTIYNQVGIAGSAAVSGDTVYFGARDSFFYALRATTGALRWKHDEHGSWVIASPAVSGGNVYYATSDEKRFWALDAATGRERFKADYGMFAFSSPAIASDTAYFGTFDGRLYGVNLRTGRVSARFSTDGSRKNLAAHLDANGEVDLKTFYTDNTFEGGVAGVDRIFSVGSIVGSPAIADGVLYVGSTDGTLYALE